MEEQFLQLFKDYGIYAVFALCTIEGDITLLLAGVLAHSGSFGDYGIFWVYVFGILGAMTGDTFAYSIGRLFRTTVQNYSFYKMAQPRIELLIDKFGGFSLVVSKYIYGVRTAMCLFNGVGRMPFRKFIFLDLISCTIWVVMLSSIGYFFSGAITSLIGDFKQVGVALFFIAMVGIIAFYLIERYLLSQKIEDTKPETIHKIEEKIHKIEDKLHLSHIPNFTSKAPNKKESNEQTEKAAEEKI